MNRSYYAEDTHSENCVFCHRWLVRYPLPYLDMPTGFDLAAKAAVICGAVVPDDIPEPSDLKALPMTGTARCLLWRCRLRFWFASRSEV